jgi:hypothetical protein
MAAKGRPNFFPCPRCKRSKERHGEVHVCRGCGESHLEEFLRKEREK